MTRKPNIHGGGAQTNVTGLKYERDTNLMQIIGNMKGFSIENNKAYRNGNLVAESFSKYNLYSKFLLPKGVDYKDYISSQLLPDEAFIVGDTCYIIEKKYQGQGGSVDEKLQTCLFKKEQYQKLFAPLGMKVEVYYLLSDWFQKPKYRDALNFIEDKGCKYFFAPNELISNINF